MESDIILCNGYREHDGRYDLLGVITGLESQSVPLVLHDCCVVVRVHFRSIEEGKKTFRLTMIDQDGRSVLEHKQIVTVKMAGERQSLTVLEIVRFETLVLSEFGEYAIDLAINGRLERSLPICFQDARAKARAVT